MRVRFLGGADSIGASCTVLEFDDGYWVVDCGIRMQGSGTERLPALDLLEDLGAPSAILVTHAHLDHIGALPVLHQRFPLALVHATAPTIALTRVQLLDSLKIMDEEAQNDGEIPIYTRAAVESLLTRMVPVRPLQATRPQADGPEVTFFPSGHILGACALGIDTKRGRLFLSGDVSVDNQRTIPGMRAPRFRADVAVFESTYGNRLHPPRSEEERRLVERVGAAIAAGGKVLIPAFAIGRAQEVILILLRAQMQKELPEFPIRVDGMVRRTCDVYAEHPWYLQSTLRRRIEKHGDPFFGALDTVRPVKRPEERAAIVRGEPCVIVSSSGMLSGGPSPSYALALAGDEKNLIAITGYQDEEAPGRRLLEYARGQAETITIEGQAVRPRCRVETYALSGHASGAQLASLAQSIRARDVYLVHGDPAARADLARLFLRERLGRVHLPANGARETVLDGAARGGRNGRDNASSLRRRVRVAGIAQAATGTPLTDDDLARLSENVRETYDERATLTAPELYLIWYGAEPEEPALATFEETLRASDSFEVHPTRLFHYLAVEPPAPDDGPCTFPVLAERIDAVIPDDAGLLRKSYDASSHHVTLVFAFPDVAAERWREILAAAFEGSGWSWDVHPQPNPSALARLLDDVVPDADLIARNPAIDIVSRSITLHLHRALHEEEEPAWRAAIERIGEASGFACATRVQPAAPRARNARDDEGRMEINLAYETIRRHFAGGEHAPYRIGQKPGAAGEEPFIELSFISPEVGERYAERLARLAGEIGWNLRIARIPNQNGILQAARSVLAERAVRKGPSFLAGERKVRVALTEPLPPDEAERLDDELFARTGYRFELR